MTNSQQIAATILEQLGGRRFMVMTGAKNLVALTEGGLQFKLPARFAKDGINLVAVKLNADDLYDVQYMKTRGLDVKAVREETDLYFDQLQERFTANTGLDTRL